MYIQFLLKYMSQRRQKESTAHLKDFTRAY